MTDSADGEASAGIPTRDLLTLLPKAELHLHLEGSIRPPLLLELAEQNHVDIGATSVEELEELYRFRDFGHFVELYLLGMSAISRGEDLLRAIEALTQELSAQQVQYAEVTTTAYAHHANGMPLSEYVEALNAGARSARTERSVDIRWIVDIPRSVEPPEEEWTAELLTSADAPSDVVAIGLGGPEAEYPPQLYASSFRRVAASGLPSVMHAGEVAGPPSVWQALELGSVRLGHGVRSMEDPALVDRLVENQVPLEVSVTSNVLLGVFDRVESHPLPSMLEAGINVSINTDDPAYFRTTLVDELLLAHERLGVSMGELIASQHRAIDAALCEPQLKARVHRQLSEFPSVV